MRRWALLVEPGGASGPDNMAVDAALLGLAREGGAFLRLYRWNPPCLSFGRHEPARRRYDRDAIAARGLVTVRRPTGGRAVWHDTELTYAVAAPVAHFGTLAESYRAIHAMLARALASLGTTAALAPKTRTLPADAGACFAAPVGGEVVVDGRKVIGSAQVREGDAFLQHGSILITNRQQVVSDVTVGDAPAPAAAGLDELLGRTPAFDELAAAITRAAATDWPGEWQQTAPPPVPTPNPFADPGWTWRR